MVRSLTVTFDQAGIVPAGLFAVTRLGGSSVALQVTTATINGVTVATITFTGAGLVAGSLADGRYSLTAGGTAVAVANFFRLFGDSNGDAKVDDTDRAAFLAAYRSRRGQPNYRWYFDYDSNGVIDSTDYFQFLGRYGSSV
jgi:hypothetical protein